MDIQLYEHLTLDEQIQEWYACSEPELNKLAKYLEERIKEKENEAYSEGYDNAVELYRSH